MKTSPCILIVDDETIVLDCVTRIVEGAGYRALTARDGAEALAVLRSAEVALILADIAMPEMNGYQLYEEVVRNPRWVAIPFVFLMQNIWINWKRIRELPALSNSWKKNSSLLLSLKL